MMKIIRSFLLQDTQIKTLLDNQDAIYQVEKPEKKEHKTYIVFMNKPLSGGVLKDWQIEFRIISNDLSKIIAIQSRLIKLLDDPRYCNQLKDEETVIRRMKLLNGGGTLRNPSTGNYEMVLYFLCKI